MITFSNGGIYTVDANDLPPSWIGATDVFVDVETSSGAPDKDSLYPWANCSIAGFSITVDDNPAAYYFDCMHAHPEHRAAALQWLKCVFFHAKRWVNHNVKYDAHVFILHGNMPELLDYFDWLQPVCTIVRAKLVDSDRISRGGYGLDVLCKDWLKTDISQYETRMKPYLHKNKDYGKIPGDILGEYACIDVLENRRLFHEIEKRLPERSKKVAHTEIGVTRELIRAEQRGLCYHPIKLKVAQVVDMREMLEIEDRLIEICGRSVNPKSPDDVQEILVGMFGLPIIQWTKSDDDPNNDPEQGSADADRNASFNKHVLEKYKAYPYAPHEVIELFIRYRERSQRNGLFYVPWQEIAPNGVIHSSYNQTVRTGRMSCSNPNAQQMNSFVKKLIIPRPGYVFFSTDASQIEFRFILHYIKNAMGIKKFNENPDEDFHDFVAIFAEVDRDAAKTINFGVAFSEGKKKLIASIAANPTIVAIIKAEVAALKLPTREAEKLEFARRAIARGSFIYDRYHEVFPEIKPTSKLVEQVVKSPERNLGFVKDDQHCYGYVTNCFGRDRHLPYLLGRRTDWETKDPLDKAWLGFPTLNQASAADLMKEGAVALMEAIRAVRADAHLVGVVHDEILLEVREDTAYDPRFARDVVGILEHPSVSIDVPIRWSAGVSGESWYHASLSYRKGGPSKTVQYNLADCQRFAWLGA